MADTCPNYDGEVVDRFRPPAEVVERAHCRGAKTHGDSVGSREKRT